MSKQKETQLYINAEKKIAFWKSVLIFAKYIDFRAVPDF